MIETSTTLARPFEQARAPRSLWSDAWRRLRRNKAALLGLLIVLLLGLIAIFADRLAPYPYAEQHVDHIFAPIGTPGFTLGADQLGRDLLSRLLYAVAIAVFNLAVDVLYVVADPRISLA
jgi:ABC-type antimicrobial peptide transport system permease subunit